MKALKSVIESVILQEKKEHLIKKLKNLSSSEKEELVAFFIETPSLENKIDWNNKNLKNGGFYNGLQG